MLKSAWPSCRQVWKQVLPCQVLTLALLAQLARAASRQDVRAGSDTTGQGYSSVAGAARSSHRRPKQQQVQRFMQEQPYSGCSCSCGDSVCHGALDAHCSSSYAARVRVSSMSSTSTQSHLAIALLYPLQPSFRYEEDDSRPKAFPYPQPMDPTTKQLASIPQAMFYPALAAFIGGSAFIGSLAPRALPGAWVDRCDRRTSRYLDQLAMHTPLCSQFTTPRMH